jgi:hypothetical protein
MINPFQFWGEHLFLGFPRIVSHGVSFPINKVLKFAPFSKEPVSHDGFYFKLLFSIDHFRWWPVIVRPMLFCFVIGGEERGMKDVINGPGWGKLELISDS